MMGYLGQSTLANQNISSTSYWPDSADTEYRPQVVKKSRKKAFIVAGLVVGFLAVIGIVVGVVIGRKGGSNRGVASSLSSSSSGSSNRTTQSDPNDPSNFTKDPRLHQSFWGFAYTPEVKSCTLNQPHQLIELFIGFPAPYLWCYSGECNPRHPGMITSFGNV